MLDGAFVIDTDGPLLVWEKPYYPTWFFPSADVDSTIPSEMVHTSAESELDGHVRVDWDAIDHWLEEDEEVFVHVRSPYHRIDILQSSRHVRVEVDGVVIAESSAPRLLFETGLPTRYYLPKTDVRLDLMRPSDTQTSCPYKGNANYFDVDVNGSVQKDLVWYYDTPVRESVPIAGYLCFYNEFADIIVDGVPVGRPDDSPFSADRFA
ncbi:MAG: DUF427 domain-containing protein [Acidimicrobiales bacterium]